MPFDLSEYVTVDERIQLLYQQYPDARLVTREVRYCEWPEAGTLAVAEAYRTADDPHPGVGTAWEPVPGKTTFTRDSEVQNAETAAWGRAIVALGIGAKPGQLASREEVEARRGPEESPAALPAAASPPAPAPAAAGDEHKRAHEASSTLDLKEPDRAVITKRQRDKLFALAGPDGYGMTGDQLRALIDRVCGAPTKPAEIKRWQFDALLQAVDLEGRGAQV